ncbi:MAG: transcription factor [Methanobrevibacter sp.]|nr:transcription factor [Methanobrevibacter sp.]MDO5823563.1 transcription factor [Methanobrevibacter sp.]
MIDDPLVKNLLSKIVEKDHEENLKKNFRDRYPTEETPTGIDNLIRALELTPEEIQYIANDIHNTVENTIIPIIKALIDGVETDEEIANSTEIKLNIVRRILYKLYDLKIANYKRSKDPDTQWFTYSWKFEEDELIEKVNEESEKVLAQLKDSLLKEEHNIYFACPHGHVRYNFDEASDDEFFCVCGEELMFQDNEEVIESIKTKIAETESDLKSFNKKMAKD